MSEVEAMEAAMAGEKPPGDATERRLAWCREWIPNFEVMEAQAKASKAARNPRGPKL